MYLAKIVERYEADALKHRIVARYLTADAGEEDSAKGGVPARWKEWLDAVHDGGQKKVPNPNATTKGRYPEVSFSTALKDKIVFQKAIKEYHEWAKKTPENKTKSPPKEAPKKDEESKAKAPKDEKEKSPKSGGLELKGEFEISDKELDEIIKKHKKDFDSITKDMKGEVASYEKSYATKEYQGEKVPEFAVEEFKALPEEQKMLHVAGHWVGELFEKSLSKEDKELHEIFTDAWTSSSSNPTSTQVQGALESLGVTGHQTDQDKNKSMYRDAGKKKEALKKYMAKAYAFTQAYYKHIGLKELELYRGVVDPNLAKADAGEKVKVQTRELSSFTSDPKVAAKFGTPLKMKVPVKNVMWSNLTAPRFTGQVPPGIGESELAVMGASNITGKVIGKSASKVMDLEGR